MKKNCGHFETAGTEEFVGGDFSTIVSDDSLDPTIVLGSASIALEFTLGPDEILESPCWVEVRIDFCNVARAPNAEVWGFIEDWKPEKFNGSGSKLPRPGRPATLPGLIAACVPGTGNWCPKTPGWPNLNPAELGTKSGGTDGGMNVGG